MEYGYHINLDERGEFFADVRDENDKTVIEIHGFDIFEDGFMRDKHDVQGLYDLLVSNGVIKSGDTILDIR